MYRFKPDVIYSTEMFYTCHHAILAKIFGVSHVTEMNGFALDEFRMESVSNLRIALVDFFQRLTFKLVDKVITVTPQIKQRVIDTYEIADKTVYYVPNGVNIRNFKPMNSYTARERLGLDKNFKYIGWVGYFFPWSGVELLIETALHVRERIGNIKFLIIGHGKWGNHLKNYAKKMGVDDLFIFVGAVRSEDVPIYINAMDVGTSPYPKERNESSGGSSMKTIEYWACKRPVVITNATGIPEKDILVQNRAGILVDEWDPKAFAEGIISILTDEKMAKEMGNRGYELVLRERTWEKISRERMRILLLQQD